MEKLNWSTAKILVTGGTGSFGRRFVELVLKDKRPEKVVIYSRDEFKQHEMRQALPDNAGTPIRYFVGDVRDRDRLNRALHGIDIVVHAAALKHVPSCEYNPFEAVQTNIMGSKNVIDAAIDQGVQRVIGVSTDKAVNPANLYGATKLVAEKLFIQGNAYAGSRNTRLACTRYGNVVGSRGSVVPLFREQRASGRITITDPAMTRFWITLDQGVRFVIKCLERMQGGEIFVPKIPSMKLTDLAEAMAPSCKQEIIGIRPGEKLHEVLVSPDESRHAVEFDDMVVIHPGNPWITAPEPDGGKPLAPGFIFSSDTNTRWLTGKEFKTLAGELS